MIGIHYPEEQKIFCPACGIMTFSIGEDWLIDPGAELVMNDCSHLQFLGTDDGKEIDKNYWYDQHEELEGDMDFLDYLKKTLGDDYVCFIQYSVAPAMGCGYIIFKFTEGREMDVPPIYQANITPPPKNPEFSIEVAMIKTFVGDAL